MRRVLIGAVEVYLTLCVLGAIGLTELTLHPPRRPMRWREQVVGEWQRGYGATLQDVTLKAQDGAELRAWYAVPRNDNGNAVILLHGVGDSREGMTGYASLFLQHGYRVLLPDSRAHGQSGGATATYGLLESDDIHGWVSRLYDGRAHCVYALGESMGAALALEALAKEPRLCAVVAESPYSTFRQVAYDREGLYVRLGPWFGRSVGRLPVEIGLLYARLRHGLDFTRASPESAAAHSAVPVLLIHGEQDINILPWHSVELAHADAHAQLWLVPHAEHTGAWSTAPQEFERRVLGFFAEHGPSDKSEPQRAQRKQARLTLAPAAS
jgi:uncharacterized protein